MTDNQASTGRTGRTGGTGNTGSVRADHGGSDTHKAGAFDIRTFIGTLLGLYGIILLLVGLFNSDGREINLLTGICLVIGSAIFIGWARWRPVVVPDDIDTEGMGQPSH